MHGVVGCARFLSLWRPEAEAGRVDPLQDEVPEVGRHLLPAGATEVEVEHHDRDYDRNGRNGHHHRQVDAWKEAIYFYRNMNWLLRAKSAVYVSCARKYFKFGVLIRILSSL